MLFAQLDYVRRLWKRETDPNPVTWIIWTTGAWFIAFGVWPDVPLGKWATAEIVQVSYILSMAVCQTVIAVSSVVLSRKMQELGRIEAMAAAFAALGLLLLLGGYLGIIATALLPRLVFAAGLLVDLAGWWPTYVGVRRDASTEPLLPWRAMVASAVASVAAQLLVLQSAPLGEADRESVVLALIFAVYFLIVDTLVLIPVEKYRR